jgi:hypothetical protein
MGETTTGSAAATSGYEPGGNGESRFRRLGRDRYTIGTCGVPHVASVSTQTGQIWRALDRHSQPVAAPADDVQLRGDLTERGNF